MPTFNTIIFDLDDTLIASSNTVVQGFNYALQPFNIKLSRDEVDDMRSLTSDQLFKNILTDKDAKLALSRLWEHSKQSATDTVLITGIPQLLEKISRNNIKLGLWTGRDRASAINILTHHNIIHYFQEVVGGCQLANNKPDPEGLILLAEKLQSEYKHMIHIGDHEHDIIGAKAAGVAAAHAKWSLNKTISNPLADSVYAAFETIEMLDIWIDSHIRSNAHEYSPT